jgi:hypothetical protein
MTRSRRCRVAVLLFSAAPSGEDLAPARPSPEAQFSNISPNSSWTRNQALHFWCEAPFLADAPLISPHPPNSSTCAAYSQRKEIMFNDLTNYTCCNGDMCISGRVGHFSPRHFATQNTMLTASIIMYTGERQPKHLQFMTAIYTREWQPQHLQLMTPSMIDPCNQSDTQE